MPKDVGPKEAQLRVFRLAKSQPPPPVPKPAKAPKAKPKKKA